MKYYQDITIIPCFEISVYHIWEKLFQQTHLAIVDTQSMQLDEKNRQRFPIGLAFPQYRYTDKHKYLGNSVRLFSENKQDLVDLSANQWLSKLLDYVHIKSIKEVPNKIKGYYCFWSPSAHSNVDRLARRKAKHLNISTEEALKQLKNFKEEQLDYPYIHCNSLSSDQRFRKFIKTKSTDELTYSGFNSYGLSSESSLPNF